jgi:bacterioferritin
MSIAEQLETHAQQELKHSLIVSRQTDYLVKMPSVTPKPVRTSDIAKDMLRFDRNENETTRNYRERFDSAERSASLPWRSGFARFLSKSRTIK